MARLVTSWLLAVEVDFVGSFLWLLFLNAAVVAAADSEWVMDFGCVKEVVVTRAAEILVVCFVVGVALFRIIRQRSGKQCYLVDFACYKPPAERQVNTELSTYFTVSHEPINVQNLNFHWRIYQRSGIGEETYFPRYLFNEGMVVTMEEARVEMEESFMAVLDELFAKTCVEPREIDILIVNVSTFSPSPSLMAWIVKQYKMKEGVKTFNLSGMGCSASLIAVDMAKDLLKLYRDSYALLVGTENITSNPYYEGNDKSMMVTKCLFRVGGYALLLSNKGKDATRAKMRLLHAVRTNMAAADEAYRCVMEKEDDEGLSGVSLSTSLIDVAGDAVRRNMAILGPKVLPITEQLYYAYNMICIKVLKMNLKPYIPNFRLAFQHFCIHPGGRAVISGIGKSLQLLDYELEPSRMALHRFGNTSVSGIWYEAAYMEAKRRFKLGDRIWQISLGSGFKCNSAVWEIMRETHPLEATVWDDCIHRYPCDTRNNYPDDYCHQSLRSIMHAS